MRGETLKWSASLPLAALAFAALITSACGKNDNGNGSTPSLGAAATLPGMMQGVTDTEIRIGTLQPLQGVAAATGIGVSRGMQAYYDYINDQGGIYGRKIKLFVEDTQFSGPIASEAVRSLVEEDHVFAIQGTMGMEQENAVYRYLEERGIPDMFFQTGGRKFTEPVARTRFSFALDNITQGRVFARYVYQNYNGQELGLIAQSDEAGKEFEQGVRDELKELNADVDLNVQHFDLMQSDVTAQVQRLKAVGVTVMLSKGWPVACANMIKTVRETLSWDVPTICDESSAQDVTAQLAGYDNIEGTVSALFIHVVSETDPAIAEIKELMAKYAPNQVLDPAAYLGWVQSEAIARLLKQAGPGLTRESFLDAAEAICKFWFVGSSSAYAPASTSPTDHRIVESEMMLRAVVDRSTDPPTFRWQPFGDPVVFESTKDCVTPTPPPGAEDQPGPSMQDQRE